MYPEHVASPLYVGAAASAVAGQLRRLMADATPADADTVAWLVRRTLEEMGVRCGDTPKLQDLKGFLIASPQGAEMVVSSELAPTQQVAVYAHLLAHLLLDRFGGSFMSKFEYCEGRIPSHLTAAERREDLVADVVALAILEGRLEAVPRYVLAPEPLPRRPHELRLWLTEQARAVLASGSLPQRLRPIRPLRTLTLTVLHWLSLALFWHSRSYRRLRTRPLMAQLVHRLAGLLGEPAARAA